MKSKTRFSNRVDDYVKYRPRYPREIVDTLQSLYQLSPDSQIADIGSGTGFLSELFLRHGNKVFGVEPNKEMRQAGEHLLAEHPRFTSIAGSAEESGLPANTVDFVMAGQAFHWFDMGKYRAECQRILKQDGYVVLIWNERKIDTPFLLEYERLLNDFGTDYKLLKHRNFEKEIDNFYRMPVSQHSFDNGQQLDYAGLKGRLLSSSYIPKAEQPRYEEMIFELDKLFKKFQKRNCIIFSYITKMFVGQVNS